MPGRRSARASPCAPPRARSTRARPIRSLMNVSFLGLGAIGLPMARHLVRPPFALVVWNRTPQRARDFAVAHAEVRLATSPGDAARGADVVVTCLPTSREVEALLDAAPDGSEGLLAGLAPGSVLVDCTSGDP